eukprot:341649-Alexandrium_andersonii.AAC.1
MGSGPGARPEQAARGEARSVGEHLRADSACARPQVPRRPRAACPLQLRRGSFRGAEAQRQLNCLLYTSDAADDM